MTFLSRYWWLILVVVVAILIRLVKRTGAK